MGTYTELYGQVTLKPEVAKVVYNGDTLNWNPLRRVRGIGKHPDVRRFLNTPRFNWIGGSHSFHVDAVSHPIWIGLAREHLRAPHPNRAVFYCSLKNYDDTIENFTYILPLIADDWYLFSQYEDDVGWDYGADIHRPYRTKEILRFGHDFQMNGLKYTIDSPPLLLNKHGQRLYNVTHFACGAFD